MNLTEIISKIEAANLTHYAIGAANMFDYGGLIYIVRIALNEGIDFTMKFGQVDDLAAMIRTN